MQRADRTTWAKRVERWKESGLTAAEYAAEIGANANTLVFWKWKLGSEARRDAAKKPAVALARRRPKLTSIESLAPARPAPSVALSFIEFPREVVAAGADPFEVVLLNGLRVRVPPAFKSGALGRLLDVVERRA
jgi:hypothetical protein